MADVTITLKGVDDLSGVVKGASGALGGMADIAGGALAVAIGGVLTPVLDGAIGALGDFFGSALEAEQGQARLAQVIKSTGGAAGLTQDAANDLAQQFMNLAGGSDDAILAIEEMGLRMGTISAEEMPAFIQSSLDLGAVMGDNATAARVLAQAQEDPIGVLGRLRKAGILFTEDQEKAIKAMVESGDAAGATALVMERLAEATGGAAAANAETLAGKWEVFKGRLGEAGEAIGTAVLPIFTQLFDNVLAPALPMIESLAQGIGGFVEALMGGQDLGGAMDSFIEFFSEFLSTEQSEMLRTLAADFQGFIDTLIASWPQVQANIGTFWASAQPILQQLGDFITLTVIPAITNLVNYVIANWPMIQASIETSWAAIQPVLQAIGDFIVNTVIPLFQQGVDWVVINWPTIQATIETVINAVRDVINTVLNEVVPFVLAQFTQIKGWVDENWPLIQATIETVINAISAVITTVITAVTAFWDEHHKTIETVANTIWTNIQLSIDTIIHLIEGILKTVMQLITGDWEGAWTTIKETAATIWDNIKLKADTDINAIKTVITDVMTSLKTWWETTWASIKTTVETMLANLLSFIITKVNEFKSAFTNIDWGAIGSGIIGGITQGVMNAAGGLGQAAADAANWALQQAKNALGISSPSKAFMGIGENMMAGMALGIGQNARLPAAAMAGATGNVSSVANINIDARGAQRGVGREVERATTRALKRAGQQADARLRLRGAM